MAEVWSNLDEVDISRSSQHHGCIEVHFGLNLSGSIVLYVNLFDFCVSMYKFVVHTLILIVDRFCSFFSCRAMFPKSRGPPLPSSAAFSTGQIPVRSAPLPPPPSCHPVANVQTTQVSAPSSFPKTSGVSLNFVGRLGQYCIEAATADSLTLIMDQIFDAERRAEMQRNMWNFQQMMMTMSPTLLDSPCSWVFVYQPCRGSQRDTTGPEPSAPTAGTMSTVGHSNAGRSITGPGPSQCDPVTTKRRRTVETQLGPYGLPLPSPTETDWAQVFYVDVEPVGQRSA